MLNGEGVLISTVDVPFRGGGAEAFLFLKVSFFGMLISFNFFGGSSSDDIEAIFYGVLILFSCL